MGHLSFQILNSLSFVGFCAAAGFTGRRGLHLALVALALGLDLLIAVLLHIQRAVLERAPVEMVMPVKALHIASAVLGLLLMICCLVMAWRRWRRSAGIGPAGIALLALTVLVRALAFGTSFLMTVL
jgi:hypothetical protein